MFPTPATILWFRSAALIGAVRPAIADRRRCHVHPGDERLGPRPSAEVLVQAARVDQPHRAEPALVGVQQQRAVVEGDPGPQVAYVRIGRPRGAVMEPSGHTQVHDQRSSALQRDQQVLAAAADAP